MRPLIIGPEEDVAIKRCVEYAKANILPCNKLLRLSAEKNPEQAVGLNPMTRVEIPFGYRVVYSQEEQPVHGICHHISVSVDTEDRLPNENAVNMIMNSFGMKTTVREAMFVYTESLDGNHSAINIIQPLERRKDGTG
jgi:hypothetical protein